MVMNFLKLDVYFNSLSLNTFLLKNRQLSFINYIYICFPRDIIQLLHGFIILVKVGKHLEIFCWIYWFLENVHRKVWKNFSLIFFSMFIQSQGLKYIFEGIKYFSFIKIFVCTPLQIVLIHRKVLHYQMLLYRMIYQMFIRCFVILRRYFEVTPMYIGVLFDFL